MGVRWLTSRKILPLFLINSLHKGSDMNWNLKIKILFTLFFIFLSFSFSYATIHYVSHNGNDIPPYLSWQDAADSIQAAINVCAPGDTVLVANGVYYENLVISTQLWLIGLSADSTVINGLGMGGTTILVNVGNYFSIANFTIYGKGEGITNSIIVDATGDSVEVKNCNISEAIVGIFVSHSCKVDNVIVKNITRRGFGNTGALTNSNDLLINNIMIFDATNSNAINVGAGTYFIRDNIILFTGTEPFSGAPGIQVGLSNKVYIYNNLISGFDYRSIYFDTVTDTAFIKNNLIIYGGSLSSSANIIYVYNVILSNNSRGIYQLGSGFISSDYNLFWGNGIDLDGTTYGDSDRVANPMFVKDTLPNPELDFDYHLQAYSPGIDKGDPNIFDIDSSRSDIGLYGGPFGETYTYQNLAPRAPVNLSGVVNKSNNTIVLNWNRNSEADTAYYNVYRDTTENFIISPANLISSPTDTSFTEPIPTGAESLYYKITAVDIDENESLPSEEIFIDIITGVTNEPITINDYRLYQNYPNPFNPTTKIGYRLKERGKVKLMVYDIKGELVTVLVNKEQSAGYYEVEFSTGVGSGQSAVGNQLASGIYLYRIEIIGEGNIPVYSDMLKMILIK